MGHDIASCGKLACHSSEQPPDRRDKVKARLREWTGKKVRPSGLHSRSAPDQEIRDNWHLGATALITKILIVDKMEDRRIMK